MFHLKNSVTSCGFPMRMSLQQMSGRYHKISAELPAILEKNNVSKKNQIQKLGPMSFNRNGKKERQSTIETIKLSEKFEVILFRFCSIPVFFSYHNERY